MTTIAAAVLEGCTVWASDSLIVGPYGKSVGYPKFFSPKKGVVVGVAGDYAAYQALERKVEWSKTYIRARMSDSCVWDLVDCMIDVMAPYDDSTVLMQVGERLFEIDGKCCVNPPRNFHVIGSGSHVALGWLMAVDALPRDMHITDLDAAVLAATSIDLGSSAPIAVETFSK